MTDLKPLDDDIKAVLAFCEEQVECSIAMEDFDDPEDDDGLGGYRKSIRKLETTVRRLAREAGYDLKDVSA